MKKPKFLVRNWNKYKRLGLRNKKKLKWRRPRGIHSKMRKRRAGYPVRVEPGYGTPLQNKGKIAGLIPMLVKNTRELEKAGKGNVIIIAHVGKKKREDIIKKAEALGIKIQNK